jgi:hypothetical protein
MLQPLQSLFNFKLIISITYHVVLIIFFLFFMFVSCQLPTLWFSETRVNLGKLSICCPKIESYVNLCTFRSFKINVYFNLCFVIILICSGSSQAHRESCEIIQQFAQQDGGRHASLCMCCRKLAPLHPTTVYNKL